MPACSSAPKTPPGVLAPCANQAALGETAVQVERGTAGHRPREGSVGAHQTSPELARRVEEEADSGRVPHSDPDLALGSLKRSEEPLEGVSGGMFNPVSNLEPHPESLVMGERGKAGS